MRSNKVLELSSNDIYLNERGNDSSFLAFNTKLTVVSMLVSNVLTTAQKFPSVGFDLTITGTNLLN